jgi:hypothetical protein
LLTRLLHPQCPTTNQQQQQKRQKLAKNGEKSSKKFKKLAKPVIFRPTDGVGVTRRGVDVGCGNDEHDFLAQL